MDLLCLNKKCNNNENCKCKNVYLYVDCFRFEDEYAKSIIERHFNESEIN